MTLIGKSDSQITQQGEWKGEISTLFLMTCPYRHAVRALHRGEKNTTKKSTSNLFIEDETKFLKVSTVLGQVCAWSLARLEDP